MSGNRKCPQCGTVSEGNFCPGCGSKLEAVETSPPNGPKKSSPFAPRIIAAAALFIILAALIGSVFYLTRGFKNIDLLPAIIASICENGISGRLDPVDVPVSGTPALDVTPVKGVRIQAPANALDCPRTFTARKLSEEEIDGYADQVYARGAIPVYGFDIDAGMKPDEVLPGEIGITFDLNALKVPREAWEDMKIVRLDPGGNLAELKTVRSGSRITCYERHNGIFMAVLVGFAIGLPVATKLEQNEKFKDEEWHSYSSENFRVFWPKSMPPRNPQEMARVEQELENIWQTLWKEQMAKKNIKRAQIVNMLPNPLDEKIWDAGEKLEIWVNFETHPETKRLKEMVSSDAWLKKNFIPLQVSSTLEILERTYSYLTGSGEGQRGFRGATFRIDVLFRQKWPYGPDIPAMTVANRFIYSYIDVNLAEIPDKDLDASGAFDDLYTTIAHELFHCLQSRYFSSSNAYAWFEEATAVTLEGEAGRYFTGKGWIKTVHRTDRAHLYDAYLRPMDYTKGDRELLRWHGYGQSYFMEYLRDKYYPGAEAAKFLPRLLDTFSGWRSGTVDSIYKATSGKAEQLAADFASFCTNYRVNIVNAFRTKPISVTLGSSTPIFEWEYSKSPLSCEFRQLIIPDARPLGTPDRFRGMDTRPILVIKGVPDSTNLLCYYSHSPFDRTWTPIGSTGIFMPLKTYKKNTRQYEIWLQRIHAYTYDPGKITYKNGVFVMHPPTVATAEKPKKGRITISWPQSPLKQRRLIGGYRVLVWAPNSKEDKPFVIDTDKTSVDLVLKDILGKYKPKKDEYLEVVYREKLITSTPVYGPPSEVLKVKLPVDDFSGRWKGTITITDAPIQAKLTPWIIDFFHFLLQKWLTREDVARAITPTKLVGSSTKIELNITPLDDTYENYRIELQTAQAENWREWKGSFTGDADNGVLQFMYRDIDGSQIYHKCYLESEKSMKGEWFIDFLMMEAIKGTFSVTKIGPPRTADTSAGRGDGNTGP